MASAGITTDDLSMSKVDPCEVCSLRVLCVRFGGCVWVKRVSIMFFRDFACRKCEVTGRLERQWSWMESYVMKW